MNISRIDHVNIVVADLEAAKQFFTRLGLVLSAERELHGDWIDTTVGLKDVHARFAAMTIPGAETVVELLSYDSPVGHADPLIGNANQIGFRHIAFCVDNIDKWYSKLNELNIECYSEVQEVPNYRGKKIVYFKGPEGIILELAEYPKEIAIKGDEQ